MNFCMSTRFTMRSVVGEAVLFPLACGPSTVAFGFSTLLTSRLCLVLAGSAPSAAPSFRTGGGNRAAQFSPRFVSQESLEIPLHRLGGAGAFACQLQIVLAIPRIGRRKRLPHPSRQSFAARQHRAVSKLAAPSAASRMEREEDGERAVISGGS